VPLGYQIGPLYREWFVEHGFFPTQASMLSHFRRRWQSDGDQERQGRSDFQVDAQLPRDEELSITGEHSLAAYGSPCKLH
jgi:hypothetical protein